MSLKERLITTCIVFLIVFLSGVALNTRPMLLPHIAHAAPICPPRTTFIAGQCVGGSACPVHSTLESNNEFCMMDHPPTCPSDYTGPGSNGQCTGPKTPAICPSGSKLELVICVTDTVTPATCPSGTTFQGGECVQSTSIPPTCPAGTTGPDSGGQCTKTTTTALTCPPGFTADPYAPQRCISEQPPCQSDRGYAFYIPNINQYECAYFSSDGHCFNGGTLTYGNYCIFGPILCPPGTILSGTSGTPSVQCVIIITCQTGTLQITSSFPHTGQCVTTTTVSATCPQDTTLQGGECVQSTSIPATCPSGTTGPDSQGQCTSTTSTPATCPPDTKGPDSQGQCAPTTLATCPSPEILVTGSQIGCEVPINCPMGTSPDSTGTCVGKPIPRCEFEKETGIPFCLPPSAPRLPPQVEDCFQTGNLCFNIGDCALGLLGSPGPTCQGLTEQTIDFLNGLPKGILFQLGEVLSHTG